MTARQPVAPRPSARRWSPWAACGAVLLAAAVSRPPPARADEPDTSIWTKVPLPPDAGNPDGPVDQSQDVVTGIYFKDLDHGVVVANAFHTGGVVYSATATKLTGVAYRGAHHAADDSQNVSFHGFTVGADGGLVFAVFPFGDEVIRCDKDLKFTRSAMGRGDAAAQEQYLLRETAGGKWWLIAGNGVSTADDAPSKGTDWTTIWSPEGRPPIPDPVPADMCPEAPARPGMDGTTNSFGYVSPDGMTIAYPCHSGPAVCVCRDGGKTWKAVLLPGAPAPKDDSGSCAPSALLFTDKAHGWTCGEGNGTPYVYSTTDGGQTWVAGKLPDKTMAHAGDFGFRLHSIFFAPDNKSGWIVGREGKGDPLLLRTTDGGATWKNKVAGPHSLVMLTPPDGCELMSGFALDADHIWVGGRDGNLYYTDKASQ